MHSSEVLKTGRLLQSACIFGFLLVLVVVIASFIIAAVVYENCDASSNNASYYFDEHTQILSIYSDYFDDEDCKQLEAYKNKVVTVRFTAEKVNLAYIRELVKSLGGVEILAICHEPSFVDPYEDFTYLDKDGKEISKEYGYRSIVGTFFRITESMFVFKQYSTYDVVCGGGLVYNRYYNGIDILWAEVGNGMMTDYTADTSPGFITDTVNIGRGVNSIGKYAFYGSTITAVKASSSSSISNVESYSFKGCRFLKQVDLGNVETISEHAFDGCEMLSSVYLGKTLKKIGADAFYGCSSLVTVEIPASLKEIEGEILFNHCGNLKTINVAKGNENYSSIDGVLFQNKGTILARYPQSHGSEYTIPYGVTTLNPHSFNGCTGMKYLEFPETINNIAVDFMEDVLFYSSTKATEPIDCHSYSTELPGAIFDSADGVKMYKRGELPKVVTFDATPGECPISSMMTNQEKMLDSYPIAYYEGHKFEGWYLERESGERIAPDYKYDKNTTIYAHYSPTKLPHHVIYDINGGSGEAPTQADVAEGDTFVVPLYTGIKPGFVFSGWLYDSMIYKAGDSIMMRNSDITLVARWLPLVYHCATYDIDGGSGVAPEPTMVLEGDSFIADQYTGTKTGYVFSYWSCDGKFYFPGDEVTMGNEDMVLTAIWNPKSLHHVTYDTRGGSGFAPIQEDVRSDAVFTVKPYDGIKKGYRFIGWIYSNHVYLPGDEVIMGDTDITFLAFWTSGEVHHITYDVDGGDAPAPTQEDITEGYTFILPSYSGTKKGYVFKGWAYGDTIYRPGDIIVMIDKDMIFTAIWDVISLHHVVYDTRGGSRSAPVQSDIPVGSSFIVQGYDGIKEHYVFNGWLFKNVLYLPGDTLTMNEEDVIFRADWKSTESPSGGWQNPMLMFLCVSIIICVILEIFAHLLFKKW